MDNCSIYIISCTKNNKVEFSKSPLGESITKHKQIGNISDSIIYFNNTKGLSENYNDAIRKIKTDNPILIFCHDDVYLLDIFLKEKLIKAFKEYDVVGVAGSSYLSLKNERIAWHISPKNTWSGYVEHPYDKDQQYMSYFGPTPKRVAVIDGLFIAVKLNTLIDNNIKFQEEFKFDGYDTSFCLECLKKDLNIGVVNIHTQHLSHGEGIKNNDYIIISNILKEKYHKK